MDEKNMNENIEEQVTDAVETVAEAAEAVVEETADKAEVAVEETVEAIKDVAEAAPVNPTAENAYTYSADTVYAEPVEAPAGNGLAIAALICGIASIVCSCWYVGILPAIAAIICGAIGKGKCPKAGMAKWGMILGIIGAVLFVIAIILLILSPLLSVLGVGIFGAMSESYY